MESSRAIIPVRTHGPRWGEGRSCAFEEQLGINCAGSLLLLLLLLPAAQGGPQGAWQAAETCHPAAAPTQSVPHGPEGTPAAKLPLVSSVQCLLLDATSGLLVLLLLLVLVLQGKLHADTMAAIKAQLFHQPAEVDGERLSGAPCTPASLSWSVSPAVKSLPSHPHVHAQPSSMYAAVVFPPFLHRRCADGGRY